MVDDPLARTVLLDLGVLLPASPVFDRQVANGKVGWYINPLRAIPNAWPPTWTGAASRDGDPVGK